MKFLKDRSNRFVYLISPDPDSVTLSEQEEKEVEAMVGKALLDETASKALVDSLTMPHTETALVDALAAAVPEFFAARIDTINWSPERQDLEKRRLYRRYYRAFKKILEKQTKGLTDPMKKAEEALRKAEDNIDNRVREISDAVTSVSSLIDTSGLDFSALTDFANEVEDDFTAKKFRDCISSEPYTNLDIASATLVLTDFDSIDAKTLQRRIEKTLNDLLVADYLPDLGVTNLDELAAELTEEARLKNAPSGTSAEAIAARQAEQTKVQAKVEKLTEAIKGLKNAAADVAKDLRKTSDGDQIDFGKDARRSKRVAKLSEKLPDPTNEYRNTVVEFDTSTGELHLFEGSSPTMKKSATPKTDPAFRADYLSWAAYHRNDRAQLAEENAGQITQFASRGHTEFLRVFVNGIGPSSLRGRVAAELSKPIANVDDADIQGDVAKVAIRKALQDSAAMIGTTAAGSVSAQAELGVFAYYYDIKPDSDDFVSKLSERIFKIELKKGGDTKTPTAISAQVGDAVKEFTRDVTESSTLVGNWRGKNWREALKPQTNKDSLRDLTNNLRREVGAKVLADFAGRDLTKPEVQQQLVEAFVLEAGKKQTMVEAEFMNTDQGNALVKWADKSGKVRKFIDKWIGMQKIIKGKNAATKLIALGGLAGMIVGLSPAAFAITQGVWLYSIIDLAQGKIQGKGSVKEKMSNTEIEALDLESSSDALVDRLVIARKTGVKLKASEGKMEFGPTSNKYKEGLAQADAIYQKHRQLKREALARHMATVDFSDPSKQNENITNLAEWMYSRSGTELATYEAIRDDSLKEGWTDRLAGGAKAVALWPILGPIANVAGGVLGMLGPKGLAALGLLGGGAAWAAKEYHDED